MTWNVLIPQQAPRGNPLAPGVTLRAKLTKAGAQASINIRPTVHTQLPWLQPGRMVTVALGAGDNAGMIRLTPGGAFPVGRCGGRPEVPADALTLSIWLATLLALPAKAQPPTALEHDFGDDWLEATLPDWARAAPPLSGIRPVRGYSMTAIGQDPLRAKPGFNGVPK